MTKKNKHNYEFKEKITNIGMFIKKQRYYFIILILFCFILSLVVFNISKFSSYTKTQNNNIKKEEQSYKNEVDYKTVKPNEAGDILVVMYHSIDNKEKHYPWHRNKKEFKEDLEYMYKNGYVLISMKEYLSNDIDIPAGKTPILLTFDDGLKSCFSLVKNKEGKLVVNNDTLIGILENFKAEHPDFGSGGVLYITENPFEYDAYHDSKSEGTYEDKFRVLKELGYEIGNHTYNHLNLNELNNSEITKEIGKVNNLVYENTNKDKTIYLAYPYGDKPKKSSLKAIKSGTYKDITYNIESAVLAAPEKPYFTNPIKKDFNPYYISRAIANKGQHQDMYWYFDYYKKNPDKKYISDGDKSIISIPSNYKDSLNPAKTKGFNVVYYDEKTFEKIN